jgi:hypothetical protein
LRLWEVPPGLVRGGVLRLRLRPLRGGLRFEVELC